METSTFILTTIILISFYAVVTLSLMVQSQKNIIAGLKDDLNNEKGEKLRLSNELSKAKIHHNEAKKILASMNFDRVRN